MKKMITMFYQVRRFILRTFIPKFLFPKFVILNGAKIDVRNSGYTFGVKLAICRNTYEINERILLEEALNTGDHVLEMGASVGIVSRVILSMIGSAGVLKSIEASESVFKTTNRAMSNLTNFQLIHGLGFPVSKINKEKYSRRSFNFDRSTLGGHLDFESEIDDLENSIPIYDISSLTDESFNPSVLVLDIEGSEIVLLDLELTIPNSIINIIIELHEFIYGPKLKNEIIERLVSLNYEVVKELNDVFWLRRKANC